ncbi:MAG: branched-chain amino acid aminotransferase [Tissierellia bacterium]|nr:branched-chain amino acid aminotransferase [Tissierellia bacterium]
MVDIKVIETKNPSPDIDEDNLAFGREFTDHMFIMDFKDGSWQDPRIVPFSNIELSPAAVVLHYGAEIFEGLKAYRREDGRVQLFRPELNIQRLNKSAERLALPTIDEEDSLEYLKAFVKHEERFVPSKEGASLYIRPLMIGVDAFLGVHPANEVKYIIMASPSGSYYGKDGLKPVKIIIENEDVRAVRGGTGMAKCGGNYGAQIRASKKALDMGFMEVLWLDGVERKYIDEVGAMNVFFVIDDTVVTPELNGSILSGVTRRSIIELLKDQGYKVEERKISVQELIKGLEEGRVKEAFGTGTAAVITPIGSFTCENKDYVVGDFEVGKITMSLYESLMGIQRGKIEDKHAWTKILD